MITDEELVDTIPKMHGLTKEQAEARLFDLYNELNATRFNSELPTPLRPLIRVSWEAQGLASFKSMGSFVSIYVHPACKPENYRRTMFHEMCHFYAEGHGEAFEQKLREVAAGELWLEDELAQLVRWRIDDQIKMGWIEIVFRLAEENPEMPWTVARRKVADELGVKVADVRDAVWNFKEQWFHILNAFKHEGDG